ncbi:MAG: MoaD/ThiS family protein [Nitrososphaerota archaeon]
MIIEFIGPLKKIAGAGRLELTIDREMKLIEILKILPEPIRKRVLESSGKLSPDIIFLVNDVEVKSLGLENIPVKPSDKIVMIPIIHGG